MDFDFYFSMVGKNRLLNQQRPLCYTKEEYNKQAETFVNLFHVAGFSIDDNHYTDPHIEPSDAMSSTTVIYLSFNLTQEQQIFFQKYFTVRNKTWLSLKKEWL